MKMNYKERLIFTIFMVFVINGICLIVKMFNGVTPMIEYSVYVTLILAIIFTSINMIVIDVFDIEDCFIIALVPLIYIYFLDINIWFKVWATTGLISSFIGIITGIKK